MKPTVYLETTIIGNLAMRPSSRLRVAADQQITREWWDNYRHRYNLVVSVFVIDECLAGDPVAAQERLVYLESIPLLDLSDDVEFLTESLMADVPLPAKARIDASHISVAAVHGVQYLLTWNCKHIANPSLRQRINNVCRELGHKPPTICTPREFLELNHGT